MSGKSVPKSVAVDATAVATAVERDLAERIDRVLLTWDEIASEGESFDIRAIASASAFRDLLVETLVMLDYPDDQALTPDDQALTPEEKSFPADVLNL